MEKQIFRSSDIPSKPGVYVYRDRFGDVIYVGKAANLRRRVSSYFRPSQKMRADPKLRSLINSIWSWELFPVRTADESLILESRFIKEYAPRYNVLLRDDKRYPFIKIDRSETFPRLTFARLRKTGGDSLYFGPFPHGTALRNLITYLSKFYGLRTCKSPCPGEEERKHCLSGTVRDCCRPCTGETSPEEYAGRVEKAVSTLGGHVGEVIADLKKKMLDAAMAKNYEKAAAYRDVMMNLRSLCDTRNRTFEHAFLPVDAGMDAVADLQKILHLKTPPLVIEGFDISNIAGTLAVASLVHFRDGRPEKSGYRRFRIKTVEGSNDFAMMKEAVTRHFSRLREEGRAFPDLLLVDGGKGQLSSAIEALVKLDIPAFPVLGLAKKHEEIFLPGRSEPVVVDKDRPALRLLRALRDEAHRFAISYHRELRMKLISESVLDDVPGLGPARKALLLREFGSVAELKKATPEEIVNRVRGIGYEFATKVNAFLNAK